MYLIDFRDNIFTITFNNMEFLDAVEELKYYNLYYDRKVKATVIPIKSIFDTLALFEKDSIEYKLTENGSSNLRKVVDSYIPEQRYFRNNKLDTSILQPTFKPLDFQNDCFNFTLSRSRSYISDAPGLGKSAEATITFSQWFKDKKIEKIFIVVKSGLVYHWQEEILQTVNLFTEDDIVLIGNHNKLKIFDVYSDKKIIIAPNHLLKHIFLSYRKGIDLNKSAKKYRWKSYVDIKEKLQSDKLCIVIDEAHELNNSDGVYTKALLSHIHHFDYRIALSATPNGNRFEKYFNCMQLIDSKFAPLTELAFKCKIAKEMGDDFNKYSIVEYDEKMIEYFKNKYFSLYFIKRRKEDLPEMKYKKYVKPIYVNMSEEHKNIYEIFMQNEVNKIETELGYVNLKTILNKFPYLSLIVDNPFLLKDRVTEDNLDSFVDDWKLEYDERFNTLKYLLKHYVEDNNQKVVIFDNHPDTIDMLAIEFEKYKPLVLHGDMGLDELGKKKLRDTFNDLTNDHRIIILNPQVGGVGINLNKGSSRIIYNTEPNDAVLMEQSMDRIYRINNTCDVNIDILMYNRSLELVRHERNVGRMDLNAKYLTKHLTRNELKDLLKMTVNKRK